MRKIQLHYDFFGVPFCQRYSTPPTNGFALTLDFDGITCRVCRWQLAQKKPQ